MKRKQIHIAVLIVIVLVVILSVAYFATRKQSEGKPLEGLGGIVKAGDETYTFPDSNGRTITIKAQYTPFFDPYEQGRTSWPRFVTDEKKGVYIIRDKRSGQIIYIGQSTSNIYKTLYRHFQNWDDPTQYRVTYPKQGKEVAVFIVKNAREVLELERYLIIKYQPKDNEIKYLAYQEQEAERLHPAEEPATEQYIPRAEIEADPF